MEERVPYFVDANVLIKAFVEDKDSEKCRKVLQQEFVTDVLCLVEAEQAISRIKNDRKYAATCIRFLFKLDATFLSLDKNILFESCKKAQDYTLTVYDRIHYIIALLNGCSEIASYDKDFDGLEIKRVEP